MTNTIAIKFGKGLACVVLMALACLWALGILLAVDHHAETIKGNWEWIVGLAWLLGAPSLFWAECDGERGLTWGELLMIPTVGWAAGAFLLMFMVLVGPLFGVIELSERWFPTKRTAPDPNSWWNRTAIVCKRRP
jgi:hypothetical protein